MTRQYLPPLHVHLCYAGTHPDGAALAQRLERAFVGDEDGLSVPQPDIPTFTWTAEPRGEPPNLDLAAASRNVLVLLVDNGMCADWRAWTDRQVAALRPGDLLAACTITPHFGNLGREVAGRLAIRLDLLPEPTREDELVLRLLHAVARWFCDGKLRLFLSHAKSSGAGVCGRDLATQIKVFLDSRPGDTFFDEVSIEGGDQLADKLQCSLEDSVLVALLTDAYSSRHWCGWEVLTAKRLKRPVVVVDALRHGQAASLAYLGKARTLRWPVDEDGKGATEILFRRIVAAALLEVLRLAHDERRLEQVRLLVGADESLVVSAFAPEPALLPEPRADGLALRVLHPDPPLPTCELALLGRQRPDLTFLSATQALAGGESEALHGMRVALSVSEAPDLAAHGFTRLGIERMWSRVAIQLIAADAELAYGGDLRTGGYTDQLIDLCRRKADAGQDWPDSVVHWFVPWPVAATLDTPARAALPRAIRLHEIPAPIGLDAALTSSVPSPADVRPASRLALTLAFSEMRHRMAQECSARVLVGGQLRGIAPWPGLLEELETFLELGKPVFIVGGLGGMTAVLMRALRGDAPRELTATFQDERENGEAIRLFIEGQAATGCFPTLPRGDLEYRLGRLHDWGLAALGNGLTSDENERLLVSCDASEIISLIMRGLDACARK